MRKTTIDHDELEAFYKIRLQAAKWFRQAADFGIRLAELVLLVAVFRAAAEIAPGAMTTVASYWVFFVSILFLVGWTTPAIAWLMRRFVFRFSGIVIFLAAMCVAVPIVYGVQFTVEAIVASHIAQP